MSARGGTRATLLRAIDRLRQENSELRRGLEQIAEMEPKMGIDRDARVNEAMADWNFHAAAERVIARANAIAGQKSAPAVNGGGSTSKATAPR